ncbi:MAG: hypothetical protein V2I63_05205 [Pseudomonadales bacterium]|jgi:hypothetical protein|nr:hypothetical protein [Pseudomonadales bacterium]
MIAASAPARRLPDPGTPPGDRTAQAPEGLPPASLEALGEEEAGLATALHRIRDYAASLLAQAGVVVAARPTMQRGARFHWHDRCALRDAASAVVDAGEAVVAARIVERCDYLPELARVGDAEAAARLALAVGLDLARLHRLRAVETPPSAPPRPRGGPTVKAQVLRMLELRERTLPGSARARDASRSVALAVGTTPAVVRRYRLLWERERASA